MTTLAIIVSILMLAPLAMYVFGRIKDPFHPLIFMGAVGYFVYPHRLLAHKVASLELLPESTYIPLLYACGISMIGIYIGWFWAGRNRRTQKIIAKAAAETPRYDMTRWVMFAVLFALIAVPIHLATVGNEDDYSGYIRDLRMLWIASAIMLVQFICLSRNPTRVLALFALGLSLTPPIERFVNYGQRGDTFRLAAIGAVFYLAWNKRPSKAVFITVGATLILVLATLQLTRDMVKNGEYTSRVDALLNVIPKFLSTEPEHANGSDEYIFGAAGIETIRETGRYGYGTGITIGFIDHILPRFLFPDKDFGVIYHAGYDGEAIRATTGVNISYGSAMGGFAHGFFELGWACPIAWIILAYVYRILWDRMKLTPDPMYQGLFIGYTMAMLYALTQDILTAEVNMLYTFLPLYLIYRLSRVKSVPNPSELTPALSSAGV